MCKWPVLVAVYTPRPLSIRGWKIMSQVVWLLRQRHFLTILNVFWFSADSVCWGMWPLENELLDNGYRDHPYGFDFYPYGKGFHSQSVQVFWCHDPVLWPVPPNHQRHFILRLRQEYVPWSAYNRIGFLHNCEDRRLVRFWFAPSSTAFFIACYTCCILFHLQSRPLHKCFSVREHAINYTFISWRYFIIVRIAWHRVWRSHTYRCARTHPFQPRVDCQYDVNGAPWIPSLYTNLEWYCISEGFSTFSTYDLNVGVIVDVFISMYGSGSPF